MILYLHIYIEEWKKTYVIYIISQYNIYVKSQHIIYMKSSMPYMICIRSKYIIVYLH